MATTAIIGFPRIGPHRELKKALEAYWRGKIDQHALQHSAAEIRRARWARQKHHGIAVVPSNDFSLYDHVLDTCCMVGAIPERFGVHAGPVDLPTYFAMARGGNGLAALEMTKWYDTNYHYLVPELSASTRFRCDASKPLGEFREAAALGIHSRPVLLGPVTFLLLAKYSAGDPLTLLPELLPIYCEALSALADAGADWVQLDEPSLATDLEDKQRDAFHAAYAALAAAAPRLRLLVATYFGSLDDNLRTATTLPIHGLHVDLARAPAQLDDVLAAVPEHWLLSLGLVDGRNVWRTDLDRALALARAAAHRVGPDRLQIAASCSLLHVPVDLDEEGKLDRRVVSRLAFATQKLDEIATICAGVNGGDAAIAKTLAAGRTALADQAASTEVHDQAVAARLAAVKPIEYHRPSPYTERARSQHSDLKLPIFPTTTIGSFPQTAEIRAKRAAQASGEISQQEYDDFLRAETRRCVRLQDEAGLDVLVHGEFERNDMVEYFGELLRGFAITTNGWVQSYGSRCVKPPIIVGDVSRPQPMTVAWTRFAQTCTRKPVKGMLTGPVTILQWSFVRSDIARADVCRQLALALRDEISDLENDGVRIIQVDEPAFREGLPLRKGDWNTYLQWAADCFRLATSGVADRTQIHTHMCYSEFNDIIEAIADLDADVISIETSRSRMELLDSFERFRYINEIGPGVYDIHSPAVPSLDAMSALLHRACRCFNPRQIWVNPDCGLKTRAWPEVEAALKLLVEAAARARIEIGQGAA
jgi:5-methyltetrahydropteroyltriglutamate--homocysteine methyltransferase